MQKLLETARTVDFGGLVQFLIYARQRGDIEDAVPAHALPDGGDNINRNKQAGVGEHRFAAVPKELRDLIDETAGVRKAHNHAAHDDNGDKVRHIGHRLDDLDELFMRNFVEQQRKNDGNREAENNAAQTDGDGVFNQAPEILALEEVNEIFESYPFVVQNTGVQRVVVLKCDQGAVHRLIAEDDIVQKHGQHQQIELVVFLEIPFQSGPKALLWPVERYNFTHSFSSLGFIRAKPPP